MKLKDAMEKTGLTQKAIRYYEQQGLIQPVRQENGYKEYDEQTIQRLLFIKALRELRFTLKEVFVILEQEEQKQQVLLDKLKACDEQILELDVIKTQLKEMVVKDGSLCELVGIKEVVQKPQYLLITDLYAFFKKFHLIIMMLCILLVFLCFSSDTDIFLSDWTDRMLWLSLMVCSLWEGKQKRKLEELTKDGYEEMQIQPQFILLEMCYAFLWNCSILWMIKLELVRAFTLPTIICRDGVGYVLMSLAISLLWIGRLYFVLKKWRSL